jgi:DNA-binding CsgD family transcriptional regulator
MIMMVRLQPAALRADCPSPIPPFLQPIIESIKEPESLPTVVQSIVKDLGFESFVYGMCLARTHQRDEHFYVWGTVSKEWLSEYDQQSYIEIDPRVCYGWDKLPPPLVWDASIGADDPNVQRFLTRAAAHGIGSGLAVYLRDNRSKIMVALSSPERRLSEARKVAICSVIGPVMHFASIFHWVFVKGAIERGIPPAQQGRALSDREICCLQYAAHGMTSRDIGVKLGIAQRTANFHFANIISKLGVLNRHEAISTAMSHGFINMDGSPCELETKSKRTRPKR